MKWFFFRDISLFIRRYLRVIRCLTIVNTSSEIFSDAWPGSSRLVQEPNRTCHLLSVETPKVTCSHLCVCVCVFHYLCACCAFVKLSLACDHVETTSAFGVAIIVVSCAGGALAIGAAVLVYIYRERSVIRQVRPRCVKL